MKMLATIITAGIGYSAAAVFAANTFGPLVSPEELAAGLEHSDPMILDIRGDAYADGHVPGAVSAPYALFRGPKENPGQMLDVATLEERYEALGLQSDQPIVIVPEGKTDTDFGAAARVYWTLKSSGFEDLSILNGGAEAWQSAGLPIQEAIVTPEPSQLEITFSDQWTADTEQVVAVTRGEVDALLLDARPVDFHEGRSSHPAAARPGTLPGAGNHAYTSFFDEGSAAISQVDDRNGLLAQLGIEDGEQVVSFCNTGHWAATNWFALSELAGLDNVKLYPGSMVEYSQTDNEMANTPGVLKHFLNKVTGH